MRTVGLLVFCFTMLITAPGKAGEQGARNKLVMLHGHVLNLYYQGQYRELKRAELFYGYGWLDNNRVFVAYQNPDFAEAVAVLEVIDLKKNMTTELTSFGGAGESHYDVNPDTYNIVYNDSSGIHILNIANDNSFKISDVLRDVNSWGVFWIDKTTIGSLIFEGDKTEFKKIKIENH